MFSKNAETLLLLTARNYKIKYKTQLSAIIRNMNEFGHHLKPISLSSVDGVHLVCLSMLFQVNLEADVFCFFSVLLPYCTLKCRMHSSQIYQ